MARVSVGVLFEAPHPSQTPRRVRHPHCLAKEVGQFVRAIIRFLSNEELTIRGGVASHGSRA
jgi:hypothetical protein